jgi:hypothetical protein
MTRIRRLVGILAFSACVLFAVPANSFAQPAWAGVFDYQQNAGQNVPGQAIIVDYRLNLGTAAKPQCTLAMEGYQTDETIICTAFATGNGLAVLFKSYEDGSVLNKYGVAEYKPGGVLFTLFRSGPSIKTMWGDLATNVPLSSGAYFVPEK